ncbi:MAG TPA: hypothetical protein VMT86_10080 [Bryobacteraceae bacterium]|nr:hypothetical protein [Bryobacteraceae bacterium]
MRFAPREREKQRLIDAAIDRVAWARLLSLRVFEFSGALITGWLRMCSMTVADGFA